MKNMDIVTLYHRLITYTKQYTNNTDLLKAVAKLESHQNKSEVLQPKKRKQPLTAEITKLRAANDKLIMAIQYHLKAVSNAGFEEEKAVVFYWEKRIAKVLKFYKRKLIKEKNVINFTLIRWATSENSIDDFRLLGLTRYIDRLKQTDHCIEELLAKQKAILDTRPAPNTTIPTKEKLISEIRFFLRTVEMHLLIDPALNEKKVVDMINELLKEYRTQLRNTTTRRIRKNEKIMQAQQLVQSS